MAVTRYARKGIFTVTQLSYTFRLRKQRKRATPAIPHYPALKALAVRDKKIYVLGKPEIPDSTVKVYLDMEGMPDEGYVYLIGLIVAENGSDEHHSFWADSKDQEADIFEQMLAEVTRHENFVVFCYGSYERTNIRKRMRKAGMHGNLPLDRLLSSSSTPCPSFTHTSTSPLTQTVSRISATALAANGTKPALPGSKASSGGIAGKLPTMISLS